MREIVEIKWQDAQSIDLPMVMKEDVMDLEPVSCHIVGYLVHETDGHYVVAKEVWETKQYKYIHLIPKKMVETVTKIIKTDD